MCTWGKRAARDGRGDARQGDRRWLERLIAPSARGISQATGGEGRSDWDAAQTGRNRGRCNLVTVWTGRPAVWVVMIGLGGIVVGNGFNTGVVKPTAIMRTSFGGKAGLSRHPRRTGSEEVAG